MSKREITKKEILIYVCMYLCICSFIWLFVKVVYCLFSFLFVQVVPLWACPVQTYLVFLMKYSVSFRLFRVILQHILVL